MLDQSLRQELKKALEKEPEVLAAYVIGSYASGHAGKESDFDLAIVVSRKKDRMDERIYDRISHIGFPKDLDLSIVDDSSSPLFLFQIIQKGERIYERSSDETALFEASVMHRYYDTAHMRNVYNSYLKDKFSSYAN